MTRLLRVCGAVYLMAANLPAQVTSAEILGTVTDASGAAITDARVTAKQLETNAVREIVTDSEGRFRMPTLQPGTYEITVFKSGFA
jgi:protocatechuate 3,4-dioxygenase beta subunit